MLVAFDMVLGVVVCVALFLLLAPLQGGAGSFLSVVWHT